MPSGMLSHPASLALLAAHAGAGTPCSQHTLPQAAHGMSAGEATCPVTDSPDRSLSEEMATDAKLYLRVEEAGINRLRKPRRLTIWRQEAVTT